MHIYYVLHTTRKAHASETINWLTQSYNYDHLQITQISSFLIFFDLVWQKLEEENAEFFKAYHIRLKLKNQIDMYNELLEQQYHLMKEQAPTNVVIAPVQNGMHHMPGMFFSKNFLNIKEGKN